MYECVSKLVGGVCDEWIGGCVISGLVGVWGVGCVSEWQSWALFE